MNSDLSIRSNNPGSLTDELKLPQSKLEELATQASRAKGAAQAKALSGFRDELRRLQRAGSGLTSAVQRPILVSGVSKSLTFNSPTGGASAAGQRFVARTINLERH